jgi:hypothetical protein
MLKEFVRFCLEHGLGGLALLAAAACATLLTVFAVASATMWTAGMFAEGFRKGWHKRDDKPA